VSKVYRFERSQSIKSSVPKVWDFISSPENLNKITPASMSFSILKNSAAGKMYPGMIISYKVAPLAGIKLNWVTEITHVKDQEYFVDEQRFGPFAFWHHKHFIKEKDGVVVMTDIIDYKIPFGFLGDIAQFLFVGKRLKQIFEFRRLALNQRFPGSEDLAVN
jgi:ligand-binding SRPBCC domain-containing protein